ncbi:MAG: glycerate kinase [Lutibacter sp.]|uniref:glycerate kinase n=1 Tax=Lutibacter sp. TaxID=1925666 RepID=UPI00299DFDD8|nr:glycerate kinase [Lutibacter sp.]MDX1828127.1 glycerate kinase [Lutibacter sp.]
MKVVIAPDKFKGSLSAQEVCNAVEKGLKRFDSSITCIKHPLADGGEGTLDILEQYLTLETVFLRVKNPIFETIVSSYKTSKDTAFIEMSKASGLELLKENERNCFYTSTFGTGELIADAVERGFKNIVLFIGGSATNDAGIGMAAALGYEFFDSNNSIIKPIGKELINITKISSKNVKFNLSEINFKIICDVKNPLYGKNGAAFVYAKQKGANSKEIEILNEGLINFDTQVKKSLKIDVANIEGAGAAGGLGAGALSFLNAQLVSGINFVFEQTNFNNYFKQNIDLIITGEGSIDKQTLEGKVVKGICEEAKKFNIPVCIVSGIIEDKQLILAKLNPIALNSIMELKVSTDEAMSNAKFYIEKIIFNQLKIIKKAN